MTIGERIKYLRLQKKMTQEELGNKVGVGKQAIYKYETGLVTNLKQNVIAKLASALDVSPSYLMGWEDESGNRDLGLEELHYIKKGMKPDEAHRMADINATYDQVMACSQEARDLLFAFDTLPEIAKDMIRAALRFPNEKGGRTSDSA